MTLPLSIDHFGPFPMASGGVATWASPPATVASQCASIGTASPSPKVGFYRGGGFVQTFCTYEIGTHHVTNDAELAAVLTPIDSPRKALAMVALSRVLAYEPALGAVAPGKEVRMPEAVAARGIPRAFEFETHTAGYLVRVPIDVNCPSAVIRKAFRVTTAGEVCEADEPSILLDIGSGVCAD